VPLLWRGDDERGGRERVRAGAGGWGGWEIVGEYVDAGVSGARERRPELDRMLVSCKRRQVDAVETKSFWKTKITREGY
jgi:DNA invertase Pin-like site-specific DNA recombinase